MCRHATRYISSFTGQASASTNRTGSLMPAAPSFAAASGLFLHIVEPSAHPRLGRRVARLALLGFFCLVLELLVVRFLLTLVIVGFLGDVGRKSPQPRPSA